MSDIPDFATPLISCTGAILYKTHMHGPHALREHCGGCGFVHERENLQIVGPFADPRDVLRALGRKSGHVGGREGEWICASGCCRNSRESAMWHFRDRWAAQTRWVIDETDAEAALRASIEAEGERLYASSYGLGL